MKISRTEFLKNCSLALAGVLTGGMAKLYRNPAGGAERATVFRLQDATASLFRKYESDSFMVCAAGRNRTRLVLAEVVELPVTKYVEQFSLIFHGPAGAAIPDGTHKFQHPALGTFDLFVVAVGMPNDRRVVYEACFSRHVRPAASAVL